MTNREKPVDTQKRGRRKSLSAFRWDKTQGAKSGRPAIDHNQLLGDRDAILQLLSSNWDRIGWRLKGARTPEKLRKALRPLKNEPSKHLVQFLLRVTSEKATAVQIRRTFELVGEELTKNMALRDQHNLLAQKFDQAESATWTSAIVGARVLINAEFKKRSNEFEICERNLIASDYRLADLETRLADQRAYFSQNELLRFKGRGYSHNPKVFADAIAGLPTIGTRQSFRLCSKEKSPLWPSHHFEVFKFIERIWDKRGRDSEQSLASQFKRAILNLPKLVRVDEKDVQMYGLKSKYRGNYLRQFLCQNWRFLARVLSTSLVGRCHPKLAPYLIVRKFFINIRRPRTQEEVVLSEIEVID